MSAVDRLVTLIELRDKFTEKAEVITEEAKKLAEELTNLENIGAKGGARSRSQRVRKRSHPSL